MSKRPPILTNLFRLSLIASLGLMFLPSPVAAQTAPTVTPAPASNPRESIPFDSGWKFNLGDDAAAKQPAFNDASWRSLDLPHDWSIELPMNQSAQGGEVTGGFFSHGIGWYRKNFTLPVAATGKKVVIEFDGVYMNSDVWINGQFLGRRPYGFVGFRYDLTDYLKTDGTPNTLAVRVDDSAEPSLRWYAGSGIYRHVRLITTGYTHFRLDGGLRITTPEVSAQRAIVETEATIDASFFSDEERQAWLKDAWGVKPVQRTVVMRSSVLGSDGKVIASTESNLSLSSLKSGQRATQRVAVPQPKLWSAGTPQMYRLRTSLLLDGKTLDTVTTPIGLRRLEFIPNRGMFVNGQETKLKGVCLHQDAGSFGNAVPTAVWAWRLMQLKEMGCNAVRPSHHPFAPEFYDLCDRLGLYVFDEAFDEWTRDWTHNPTENTRGKSRYGYHLYFNQWHEADLRAMLRQARNHPSVVIYSIGNEVPDQFNDDGYKLAKKLIDICHEEDPTRPATAACDQSFVSSRNGFMDVLDLGGYNYIDRIYQERTYRPEHERFPQRLFLGTEVNNRVHNWLGVRDNPYVIGDFIWTGIDYLGEAGRLPRRGSTAGFLDLAGGRKAEFGRRAAYWSEKPVVSLAVLPPATAPDPGAPPVNPNRVAPAFMKWNWPANAQITIRAASNCDAVEVFLNNRSLGRKAIPRDLYTAEWPVSFAPGIVRAVAYRAGKPIATSELRTAGAPARLQIKPLAMPISSDISLYEITVVDAAGLLVFDATSQVSVEVKGAGQLIGLDTGDIEFGGVFKASTRNAYQGRMLASVRRTAASGSFGVSVSTPGLPLAVSSSMAIGGVLIR